MRLTRSIRLAGLVLGALALSAAPVVARTSVDPTTLNPPPPDFFNAVCDAGAGGTVCTLAFSDPDIVDEPSGIICGNVELLFSQTRSVIGKRFYDADGNLVQRHFRESMGGTFTNANTGKVAMWTQHDTVIHNLAVPGDVATGTINSTGLLTRVWLRGGGTVLTATGTVIVDAATEETTGGAGKHPFDDYFSGRDPAALAPLCDALD